MTPGWLIELSGTDIDLQELPTRFSSSERRVVVENNRYYLNSEKFNSLTEARDVLEEGHRLISMLNGIAKLEVSNWVNIQIAGVSREEHGGSRHQFIFPEPIAARARVSANLTVIGQDGSVVEDRQPPRTQRILNLTLQDDKVEKVLRLYGSGEASWVNIYRIFEVIQSDIGGLLVSQGWATQSEINTFTQTANSAQAVGDEARHGHNKIPAPRRPLTLKAARNLIARITNTWLDYKLSKNRYS